MKIENFEKKTKKKFLRYGGEGATHKICHGSMQRFLRNMSLWTTDACVMTVALLTKYQKVTFTLTEEQIMLILINII